MSVKKPIIVMTGGGTGGHIKPILALAEEVKRLNPHATIVYIGERKGRFDELTKGHPAVDQVYAISAGKLRRYHGESWLRRVLDVKTNALNARDAIRFVRGVAEARRLLRKIKPDLVFQKGGFVGVPVGIAAGKMGLPLVTHDSDTVPGLANRMVSRWAVLHATAYPAERYDYPKDKVLHVGVLVEAVYKPVTPDMNREAKLKLTLNPDAPLLLITGGSSGAEAINKAVVHCVASLLQNHATLQIIHQVGTGKTKVYSDFTHDRLKVVEFMNPMVVYTTAADIIVTRAGANAIAEFGVQGKACIIVPSPYLTGGHQVQNGKLFAEQGAAIVIEESQLYDSQHGLLSAIEHLLINPQQCQQLAETLQKQTITDASHRLAVALLAQIKPVSIHETTQAKS